MNSFSRTICFFLIPFTLFGWNFFFLDIPLLSPISQPSRPRTSWLILTDHRRRLHQLAVKVGTVWPFFYQTVPTFFSAQTPDLDLHCLEISAKTLKKRSRCSQNEKKNDGQPSLTKKTLSLQSCCGFYKTRMKHFSCTLTYDFAEVTAAAAPLRFFGITTRILIPNHILQ